MTAASALVSAASLQLAVGPEVALLAATVQGGCCMMTAAMASKAAATQRSHQWTLTWLFSIARDGTFSGFRSSNHRRQVGEACHSPMKKASNNHESYILGLVPRDLTACAKAPIFSTFFCDNIANLRLSAASESFVL